MGAGYQKGDELQERLNRFGARSSVVAKNLPATADGRYISKQYSAPAWRRRQITRKPEPRKAEPILFTNFELC
jgi:hypothetical protein